jgi:hypothetical protein
MRSANYEYFGFFGMMLNATVSNLNIAATVECGFDATSEYSRTGALAGMGGYSNIRNCNISGSVTGGTGAYRCYTGGVIGYIYSEHSEEISNCTVSGSIIGGDVENTSFTGGIAGYTQGQNGGRVNITNCTISASGSISSGNALGCHTGGIVGLLGKEDVINGCTNHAPVTVKDAKNTGYIGGIVGSNDGKIHTSLNTGNINAPSGFAGGVVGYNRGGSVYSCCTNQGNVNSQPPSDENQIGGGNAVTPCPDGHTKR